MSQQDPFEKLDFIPSELRTTDLQQPVTVLNLDPRLSVFPTLTDTKAHDRFGLRWLLGALSGAYPFGLQTDERRQKRDTFNDLFAGAIDPRTARSLGRVGFVDLLYEAEDDTNNDPDSVADRIAKEVPVGAIIVIFSDGNAWRAFRYAISEKTNRTPYRASFARRKPATEKGMKWTISAV